MLNLEQIIKNKLKDVNKDNLQFVFDFDGTLIEKYVNGEEVPSLISVLRKEKYLDDDYNKRANELFDFYRKFEIDNTLSREEKSQKMYEWWTRHYELKREKGLSLDHILKAMNSPLIVLRPGVKDMLTKLNEMNIPVYIFSASGLGEWGITPLLEREGINFTNIKIISNKLNFDTNGKFISWDNNIIHSMNKSEDFLPDMNWRMNFIIAGDGVGDADMIHDESRDGEERHVVRIGLYDLKDESKLNNYLESFDIVLNSGMEKIDYSFIVNFLENLTK